MAINDYYKQLNEEQKVVFRNKVLSLTGWSYPTFYYKMKNNNFSKLEREAIEKIINEHDGED